MPTSLGPAEILVILVVALIVLGPKRLPEAGRQVGKAIAEVRKWSQGFQDEIRSTIDPDASRPSYSQPQPGYSPPPIPIVPTETPAPDPSPPVVAAAPPHIPMMPAQTPPPEPLTPVVADAPQVADAPPAVEAHSAGVTTGSHGQISEPLPVDWTPTEAAPAEPSGPIAADPPRT